MWQHALLRGEPGLVGHLAGAIDPVAEVEVRLGEPAGALDMVDSLMAHPGAAEDSMLSDFTTSVVADQSAEILRMQSLLSDL